MNTIDKAEQLITNACRYYQIEKGYLNRQNNLKPPKMYITLKDNKRYKVSLSSLRMALSFFLLKYTDIPTDKLGPMVGYSDHTSVSYNKNKIISYIEQKDKVFIPYWNAVIMLAKDLDFDVSMERQLTNHRITMLPVQKTYPQNLEM